MNKKLMLEIENEVTDLDKLNKGDCFSTNIGQMFVKLGDDDFCQIKDTVYNKESFKHEDLYKAKIVNYDAVTPINIFVSKGRDTGNVENDKIVNGINKFISDHGYNITYEFVNLSSYEQNDDAVKNNILNSIPSITKADIVYFSSYSYGPEFEIHTKIVEELCIPFMDNYGDIYICDRDDEACGIDIDKIIEEKSNYPLPKNVAINIFNM